MSQPDVQNERRPPAGAQPLPGGVGSKFHPDGSVRRFPGNTILCHLPADSPLQAGLQRLYTELQHSELAGLYTLLPPSSWHMTVFEGVCDQVRGPDFWPVDLPPEMPLAQCNAHFAARLAEFPLAGASPPYQMRLAGFRPMTTGIALGLQPVSGTEERRLRHLRDRLSDVLALRQPGHASYAFHLSLAYLIRPPAAAELTALQALLARHLQQLPQQISLGAPEFCHFDTMFAFERQFFLGQLSEG